MDLGAKIKKADLAYSVKNIKVNGKEFWPFYKIFFFDAQYVKGGTQTSFSMSQKISFAVSFFYGWKNWFGKTDYLVFSNSDQRKKVGDHYIDKSADFINLQLKNTLHIELPVFTHYPISKLKFKKVVSHLPLRLLEALYSKLFLRSVSLEGKEVLASLNKDFNVSIDGVTFGKRFLAQYWMMKVLLAWKKPKAVFVVVSYMKMGYVLAAREADVKVIEMQHGSINKSHFGYANYNNVNPNLFPNYLLAYGEGTQETFTGGNITLDPQDVFAIGHYYLHLIQNISLPESVQTDKIKQAEVSVAVSLQDDSVGSQIVPFLNKVANQRPNWTIVFVPRKTPQEEYLKMNLSKNIVFLPELNVYEIMHLCDVHSTVFSTCALEAPTLGKPNVLVNIGNKSEEYFSTLLKDSRVTRFVDSVDDFIQEIERQNFPKPEEIKLSNKTIMKPGFDANLDSVLPTILMDKM